MQHHVPEVMRWIFMYARKAKIHLHLNDYYYIIQVMCVQHTTDKNQHR
jgi:hypothetical protein